MAMACCSCGNTWIGILLALIGTFVASWCVSWLADKRERDERKRVRRATARAIVGAYLKEVNEGINVLNGIASGSNALLPTCAWSNFKLTTEIVSEILLSDTDNEATKGFRVKDFLEHTMNYFEYLCCNINDLVRNRLPVPATMLLSAQSATTGIVDMLTRIAKNLQD